MKRVDPVDTGAVTARILAAVIFVHFTTVAGVARTAVAGVGTEAVAACAAVEAWVVVPAVVHVSLALFTAETDGASATVAVDAVGTDATVFARVGAAFVHVRLAVPAGVAWHAKTSEAPSIDASSLVLARIRLAFVDVLLAPTTLETVGTVAPVRTGSVDTNAIVFARRAFVALVDVLVAFRTHKTTWASTSVRPVDYTRVTYGSCIARIGCTGVVEVTQQSRFVGRAFAIIRGHSVVTNASIQTRLWGTVVHVNFAVVPLVAVDTDAIVAALVVGTSGSVFANVRHQCALVNVLAAITTGELAWTRTRVRVYAVHTLTSILAQMTWAVVDVDVAAGTGETVWTSTLVVVVAYVTTMAAIFARIWTAWVVVTFAVLPREPLLANALVRARGVDAASSIDTRAVVAFVDINFAVGTIEAIVATTSVRVRCRDAFSIAATRLTGTIIHLGTMYTFPSDRTCTSVV